jgi:hypothetical protein
MREEGGAERDRAAVSVGDAVPMRMRFEVLSDGTVLATGEGRLPPDGGAHTAPVQWEYAMFLQKPSTDDPVAGWTHAGRHGWELVAVLPGTHEVAGIGDFGYFKRRLP